MEITQRFLTENNCYKAGRMQIVRGVMLHSTGANNPNLNRYIPGDDIIGFSRYNNHWNVPQPGGRSVCVHAFIGLDKLGKVRIYQTLPWDMVGWHSGKGSLGGLKSASFTGYIGFEIQEGLLTDARYFAEVYAAAIWLTAYLCKKFNLQVNPVTIIDHAGGHKMGIASNHSDTGHWFPLHGKSMDTVRNDVRKALEPPKAPEGPKTPPQAVKAPESHQDAIKQYPGGVAYVTAKVLNVRAGRGVKFDQLTQLKEGTQVKLMWYKDGWWSIDVPLSVSKAGYAFISGDWISEKRAAAAEVQTVKRVRGQVVNCTALNVRDKPNGKVLYTLHKGDTVDVHRKVGEWYELKEGYVFAKYLKII